MLSGAAACALLLAVCALGSVTYNSQDNQIMVSGETGVLNLTFVSSRLNNASALLWRAHSDPGVWYLNASLRVGGLVPLAIRPPEVRELRLANSRGVIGLYDSRFLIEDVTIVTWNHAAGRPARRGEGQVGISTNTGFIRRCTLTNLKYIGANRVTEDIHDVVVGESGVGIMTSGLRNVSVHDLVFRELTGTALGVSNAAGVEIHHVRVTNAGDYRSPGTGYYAIGFDTQSRNCTVHDVWVNGTGWSSIALSGNSSELYVYNVEVWNSGHNGLDIHFGHDLRVRNMSIHDSVSNNILVTYSAPGYGTHDILLEDIKTFNANKGTGVGAYIGNNASRVTIRGFVSTNDGVGVLSIGTLGLEVFGAVVRDAVNGISYTKVTDSTEPINASVFDSDVVGSSAWDFSLHTCTNAKVVNVRYETMRCASICDATFLYYTDVVVLDSASLKAVGGTGVSVRDESSRMSSTDGFGEPFHGAFVTGSDGRTKTPSQGREGSPSMAHFMVRCNGTKTATSVYNHSVSVARGGTVTTLGGLVPSKQWYRSDVAASKYTVVVLAGQETTNELRITGYAPSTEHNRFEDGERVEFRVWKEGAQVQDVEWSVDGQRRQNQTALTFSWLADHIVREIRFSATSPQGKTLSHVWSFVNAGASSLSTASPVSAATSSWSGVTWWPCSLALLETLRTAL